MIDLSIVWWISSNDVNIALKAAKANVVANKTNDGGYPIPQAENGTLAPTVHPVTYPVIL